MGNTAIGGRKFRKRGGAAKRVIGQSRPGFSFLQGMATRFFERLGQALAGRGHAVSRVNFNGGDRAFWRLPGAVDFCGRPEEWPEFLDRLIVERAISDIILFGDCRPLHRAPSASPRGVHCEFTWSRRAICGPIGSPSRKAGLTVTPRCRGIRAGIASERARVAALARPATGTGQLSPPGGRGRALHDGLDRPNVAVPALRDAPSLLSADRVCRLAAASGADASRRASRGGGDRRSSAAAPAPSFFFRCSWIATTKCGCTRRFARCIWRSSTCSPPLPVTPPRRRG